ncbi:MAG: 3-deoxy-7-phosphoheptulonate synthase [Gammaproteobacteria bacterium]
MTSQTEDLRITTINEVVSPALLHRESPLDARASQTVLGARRGIQALLRGEDDRLLVITGPCSIHDPDAALEYATRLEALLPSLSESLLLVMRVYFEKPRTTVGWKGLINDPHLDGSFKINAGLRVARRLLLQLADLGIPAGTEFLDPISPQYYADLISWGAIGARTTESQVHRELASGLSCPVGFKNATDGGLQIAVDAIVAARHPHHFLGVTQDGHSAIVATAGNPDCHVILRGGQRPNYDAASVEDAASRLQEAGLRPRVLVDCSHANSEKDYRKQSAVCRAVSDQVAAGDPRIMGVMIESFLVAGRQDLVPGRTLTRGQSITDACVGWEESEMLLRMLAGSVAERRLYSGKGRTASAA